jgi:hypothetical protein
MRANDSGLCRACRSIVLFFNAVANLVHQFAKRDAERDFEQSAVPHIAANCTGIRHQRLHPARLAGFGAVQLEHGARIGAALKS